MTAALLPDFERVADMPTDGVFEALGTRADGLTRAEAKARLESYVAWLGAKTQGVDPGLSRLAGAGLNLVPTALVVLGIGAVALAVAPRAAVRVVYGVVIASLLVDLVASLTTGLSRLGHLSVFHYMALAPAARVDASTIVVTLLLAAALCGTALVLFGRRDVRTA